MNTSKLIMGVTLAMVVSLTVVLVLVLVLLAELYCSLLLRRKRLRTTTATATPHQLSQQESSSAPPNSIYAQGVLDAPRRFLFPALTGNEDAEQEKGEIGKHFPLPELGLHQVGGEIISSPHRIGLITELSPSPSIKSLASPRPIQEAAAEASLGNGGGGAGEHFVYISNPIYDNDACRENRVGVGTPFETPDTSPSRLEMSGDDDDDDDDDEDAEVEEPSPTSPKSPPTPPLTPMKKLPVEACSVSLRDARSIGTSGSGSDTKNGSSSSSSGTPCTSPSW